MLELIGVNKTFNKGTIDEKKVITDFNLQLKTGEFVTVIGSNGAGKSTLFNLISGTELADSGMIEIANQDITFISESKRARFISRVFQDPLKGTAPSMTIEENLKIATFKNKKLGFSRGTNKKELMYFRERLSDLGLGLEDRMDTKIGLLSGGQRQAITLLMSTLGSPQLLLLDEHTAALDPKTADKVLKLTQDIVEEKQITTMMITHNISSALELGSRMVMMDEGRVVLDIPAYQKENMDTQDVLELFKYQNNKAIDSDKVLLSS